MRRILSLVVMLFGVAYMANAEQDNFFAEGKYWLMERQYWGQDKVRQFRMCVDDEVEVDGIIARRLRRDWLDTGNSELAYIGYEKYGVVYLYSNNTEDFVPIIDFNAKVGASLPISNIDDPFNTDWDYQTIEDDENVVIEGENRRIQYLYSKNNIDKAWIDGIGLSRGTRLTLLITWPLAACICDDNYEDCVVACYQDDKCLYQYSKLNDYISGLSAIDEIYADEENEPLYDLMGRKVDEPKAGQIYVTPSGRKLLF